MNALNWITGTAGYAAIGVALAIAAATHFLAPRSWSALAWAIAFGVLAAAFVGQRELTAAEAFAHQETKSKNAEKWVEQARLNAEAERAVSALLAATKARQGALNDELAKAHAKTTNAQSDASAARDRLRTTDGLLRRAALRQAAAERESRRYKSELASAVAGRPPAEDAAVLCANVLGRIDARAGELAQLLDSSRVAGQACEREYDAAVKFSNTPTGASP